MGDGHSIGEPEASEETIQWRAGNERRVAFEAHDPCICTGIHLDANRDDGWLHRLDNIGKAYWPLRILILRMCNGYAWSERGVRDEARRGKENRRGEPGNPCEPSKPPCGKGSELTSGARIHGIYLHPLQNKGAATHHIAVKDGDERLTET